MKDCNDRKTCYVMHRPWNQALPDPNCRCHKPLLIVIPPGRHIHPCPVHPDHVVYAPAAATL